MKTKISQAVTLSSIAISTFVLIITVASELQPTLKDWLKNTFSHHWVGKGILASLLFSLFGIIFYFLPTPAHKINLSKYLMILFWTALSTSFFILLFFIFEFANTVGF